MGAPKGVDNFKSNPGARGQGRVKGTPNKVTADFRAIVNEVIAKNSDNIGLWLEQVANGHDDKGPDPYRALDLVVRLAEYSFPKLARTELAGHDGGPVVVAPVTPLDLKL